MYLLYSKSVNFVPSQLLEESSEKTEDRIGCDYHFLLYIYIYIYILYSKSVNLEESSEKAKDRIGCDSHFLIYIYIHTYIHVYWDDLDPLVHQEVTTYIL